MTTLSRRELFRNLLAAGGALAVSPATLLHASAAADSPFIELPYIQLGDVGPVAPSESVTVAWHAEDVTPVWELAYRAAGAGEWRKAAEPSWRLIAIDGIRQHRVYSAVATGLRPGETYDYRIRRDGQTVFESQFAARKSADMPHRFVVFGDCGEAKLDQRHVGFEAYEAKPDFVLIPGDIVYSYGRLSDYRANCYDIYNRDKADSEIGVPLMRSTLFVGVIGNHDLGDSDRPDFDAMPDTCAYYYYWNQPLNGPLVELGHTNMIEPQGSRAHVNAFLEASGNNFPRMGSFSFDYGNAHWLILDGSGYMNWSDPRLREWIRRDLEASKDMTWKFVSHHFTPFSSSRIHYSEQQMRLICDILEEGGVDVAFCGHVHNYQRTYPLKFAPKLTDEGKPVYARDAVMHSHEMLGDLSLDKDYDGATNTSPKGIIYLTTGAGGNGLYNPETQFTPELWKPYTHKYIADRYSMTQVDIDGRTAAFSQISDHGEVIDKFAITK